MGNFHIKSLILGIGIGIVLTSVISMIYLVGMDPASNLAEEEIIKLAEKYGMVKSTSLIADSSDQQGQRIDESKEHNNKDITLEEAEIEISINPGDTSEVVADKLLKAGLIDNKDSFIKQLEDSGLSARISIGRFKIKKGMDMKSVIETITSG